MKKARLDDRGNIKIAFYYDPELVTFVRTLPNRSFNKGSRQWRCSLSVDAVRALIDQGFLLCDQLQDFLSKTQQEMKLEEINVPELKMELYPFQKIGVDFINKHEGRALLGDEMGLGKTAQALAYLQLHRDKRPVLIVCPASLKLNWQKEARLWLPRPNCCILEGRKTEFLLIKHDIYIINYDILDAWAKIIRRQIKPKVIIFDEVHFTKNGKAQRTKTAKALAKKIPHVIGLSGTPIINRPIELFNAINMINPTIFPSWWDYTSRYCGWDGKGAYNTEELNKKLTGSIMIRRLKKDVLKDLPEKVRTIIPIELDNKKEYKEAEHDLIEWLRENKGEEAAYRATGAEQLVRFEQLKQLAVKGKIKQAIKWIKEYLESGEKLVVFCTHKNIINTLMDEFHGKAVRVDGSVTGIDRQGAVDAFQSSNNIQLFVGNIKAAGLGLTLTAAHNICFLEFPWDPSSLIQAEDRCHRIGQQKCVNIWNLIAEQTLEEQLLNLLAEKQKIINSVLDGDSIDNKNIFHELVGELLQSKD